MTIAQNLTNALTGGKISDAVIASDLIAAGKLGAIQMTMATLESATLELRTLMQECLNECLADHARVSKIAEDRGWYKAYASPSEQLQMERKFSETVNAAQAQQ